MKIVVAVLLVLGGLLMLAFMVGARKLSHQLPKALPPMRGDWVQAIREKYFSAVERDGFPESHGELMGLESGGMFVKDNHNGLITVRCFDEVGDYEVDCYRDIVIVVPDDKLNVPGANKWLREQRAIVGIMRTHE